MKMKENYLTCILIFSIILRIYTSMIAAQCIPDNNGREKCQCHCKFCLNQTCLFGCKDGWYGSQSSLCQKKNVARDYKMTYQLTNTAGYPASNAVDGDMDTSSMTREGTDLYWYVRMKQSHSIQMIMINQQGGGTYNIYIFKKIANKETKFDSGEKSLCASVDLHTDQRIVSVECTHPMYGNTVKVKRLGRGHLRLYEVHVYACTEGTYGRECVPKMREDYREMNVENQFGVNGTVKNGTVLKFTDERTFWIITGLTLSASVAALVIPMVVCMIRRKKFPAELSPGSVDPSSETEDRPIPELEDINGDGSEEMEMGGYESLLTQEVHVDSSTHAGMNEDPDDDHHYEKMLKKPPSELSHGIADPTRETEVKSIREFGESNGDGGEMRGYESVLAQEVCVGSTRHAWMNENPDNDHTYENNS